MNAVGRMRDLDQSRKTRGNVQDQLQEVHVANHNLAIRNSELEKQIFEMVFPVQVFRAVRVGNGLMVVCVCICMCVCVRAWLTVLGVCARVCVCVCLSASPMNPVLPTQDAERRG